MASITFASGTVIPSTWLNDVNALVYGAASPPANPIRVDLSGLVSIAGGNIGQTFTVNGTQRITGGTGSVNSLIVTGGSANLQFQFTNASTTANIVNSGGNIQLSTGGTTPQWTYDTTGGFSVITATGSMGYGAGAGSTVTQATDKTTGVTLNRPAGRITLNGAALTANTTVSFTFTNSIIGTADVVLLQHNGGANYNIWPGNVNSGSTTIHIRNITGVSLSDALAVNFIVVKGSLT